MLNEPFLASPSVFLSEYDKLYQKKDKNKPQRKKTSKMDEITTKLYAEYYENDELVHKHELETLQTLHSDVEKVKPMLQRPFKVIVVRETREEISTRIYQEAR